MGVKRHGTPCLRSDMKVYQGSSNSNFSERDWNDALSTVSTPKIEGHAENFRKYCPDNVYISVIVAYPTKCTDKLPAPSELPEDPSSIQQFVVNISDNNLGDFFPQEHVAFIDQQRRGLLQKAEELIFHCSFLCLLDTQ
ncbi:hypothetical protein F5H01DRAFT_327326 [Linnemannia elongata]|nr:hypothetical protein F5H01DRAFT_327326 [Linnemannia elongata]